MTISPKTQWQQDSLKKSIQKKRSVRAIDRGTVYDIRGELLRASRGLSTEVTDVVMVERHRDGCIKTFHWGAGGRPTAHWMLSTAKNRVEPA